MAEHKYTELANTIKKQIAEGLLAPGAKLPGENVLARQTGYSRQTVRQAIGLLETQGLVERQQGSGTYVCGTLPRRAATMNVAVITTYIGEYIFPNILQGINKTLAEHGYTSMLGATYNRFDNERKILTDFLQKPIDGMIVEGTKSALPNPNLDLYTQFGKLGIPIVFLNSVYPELPQAVCVSSADRDGGRMAGEHLLQKGHTAIACIFKSDDIQGYRRCAGVMDAMRAAGLEPNDDHILWYTTENRQKQIAKQLRATLKGCTAVVCYNDEVALQVLQLTEGTVEVVSFDGSTYAQVSRYPFLSLQNPKEQLGQTVAETLLCALQGKAPASVALPWSIE